MAQFYKNEARLRLIRKRQWQDRWGSDYIPAQMATPREAPGIATGTILRPEKLGEREFHLLSESETRAALLALYHPRCWDIHEQRILYPGPRPHFLFGHPRSRGAAYAPFRGTLEVCEELGCLPRHPRLWLKPKPGTTNRTVVPFPFIGDLLLFLDDAQGSYAVNWTIKHRLSDFRRPMPRRAPRTLDAGDDESAVQRHQIEALYYADAGIRTQQVAGADIDQEVFWNLRDLFLDTTFPLTLDESRRHAAIHLARDAVGRDVPLYIVADDIVRETGVERRDAIAVIRQAIWKRRLRINLFVPILSDRPLRAEEEDVLERYAGWFKR